MQRGERRDVPSQVLPGRAAGCHPLVRPNYAYFNKPCRANRALIETLDKAAIRAWLR